MSGPFPIRVTADDGVTVLSGEASFPDPDAQPAAANAGFEVIDGQPVTIADGGNALLTWDAKDGGDDLLDISGGDNAKFIEAGVYAVMAVIAAAAITAAGSYIGTLNHEGQGVAQAASAPSTTGNAEPSVTLTAVVKAAAGDQVTVTVDNKDGTNAVDFTLVLANIVRIV